MKKIYSIILLAQMGAVFAQTPLLTENFDYTVDSPLTDNGWEAHSAPTTNPILTVTPGLEFEGYYGSGIGNAAGVYNTGQDVNKSFTEVTSGSVYASFLVNATSSVADQYFFLIGASPITTAFRGRVFLQPSEDNTQFSVGFSFNASSPEATGTTMYNFGQTYLFVVKYTIVDGDDNDAVSLYVFSANDDFSTEPDTPAVGPLNGTAADLNPGTVALRQFDEGEHITVDGIIVNTTWDLYDASAAAPSFNSKSVALYPNPVTNGYLNVTSPNGNNAAVEIFDVTGKKVFAGQSDNGSFNINSLSNGIYIARATVDNAVVTRKLIVNHQ